MDAILTTGDVASRRGCHPASVARIAAARKIGRKRGRDWIFTAREAAELERIVRDGPGQPRKRQK